MNTLFSTLGRLAALSLASASAASLAAPTTLTCSADDISAIHAKIVIDGANVKAQLWDNYWHPESLTCSPLSAGNVASVCEGEWSFLTGSERYDRATALLVPVKKGSDADAAWEVVWTSNTFSRAISLPCVAK